MKINLRKGLFETSSSSEDSLSVYQDMKLYILPKDVYNRFINGKVYIKFGENIRPDWSDDEDCVISANEISIKDIKIRLQQFENNDALYVPYYLSDALYYLEHYYTNYTIYKNILERYYYDVSFFEYENDNDVIFGFYGYTEE